MFHYESNYELHYNKVTFLATFTFRNTSQNTITTTCLLTNQSITIMDCESKGQLYQVGKGEKIELHFSSNYMRNNSMDQSPSSEANSHSASQEIPCLLWNLKVH